ncbi:hypothetical protein LEN26_013635 [Aphanomyces euteiches]|nr:hypothetical protein LEN26_013635 [Aphanomyces euteiches]KAH9124632.1 hypothetical protein AeMF1_004650 [Aphanomyces euteiches]KAH9184327.1 hypothetical protein AeNC1_013695 [Aphanomyces euteiches]
MAAMMKAARVSSRVQSCISGVVSTCLIAVVCSNVVASSLKWIVGGGAKELETTDQILFEFVESTVLTLALVLVVLGSLAAALILLFLLPQQFPARSISIHVSIVLRLCRLEFLVLFGIFAIAAFLWNGIFWLLVDKEFYVSSALTILTQAALVFAFVGFSPQNLLAIHAPSDPVATFVAEFPRIVVRVAQSFVLTFGIFLFESWSGSVTLSFGLMLSSAALYFVVLTTALTFSCLFHRPELKLGSASKEILQLLHHPTMDCSTDSLLRRNQPTTFLSIRTSPTQSQISFLEKRMASACHNPSLRSLDFWETYFQVMDIQNISRSQVTDLFASEDIWLQVFQVTTASIDAFTAQTNVIAQWKQTAAKGPVIQELLDVAWQLVSASSVNPVTIISKQPVVSSFIIDGGKEAVPSPWIWLEKGLAQVIWQFTLSTLVLHAQAVVYSADALVNITCASYSKDKLGVVQTSLPAILYSLASCRLALDAIRLPHVEEYDVIAQAIDSAIEKIEARFAKELSGLLQGVPSSQAAKLKSYVRQ